MAFANTRESALLLATSEGVYDLDLTTHTATHLVIPDYSGEVHAIFYNHSTRHLFAGTNNGVFRSNDQGKTWQKPLSGLPDSPVNIFRQSGTRLFSGTRQGLFASDNNGDQWVRSEGIHQIDIVDIQVNPLAENQIFAADLVAGQLFYTANGGDLWEIIPLGTSTSRISALAFSSSGRLLAGTNSDGIYGIAPPTESLANGR
jgi:ligand-binding sensor domain-containing protein